MPMPFMLPPPIAELAVSAEEVARLAREPTSPWSRSAATPASSAIGSWRTTSSSRPRRRRCLQAVANAFHAQKKKLVVVLNVGGVIETASWRDLADAILLAWQPGQEAGHAIADVLVGRTAPSGKLATTFPVRWQDVPSSARFPGKTLVGPDPNVRGPFSGDRAAEVSYDDDIWVGYRHFATKGVTPAYPFGFGMSYAAFGYAGLKLSAPAARQER